MRSIETVYNGYRFRSRTEARWAVFFERIGISYYYEHEDVLLFSGRYLPDFFLPNFDYGHGAYVEVKGVFKPDEIDKCKELCHETGKMVIMLDGVPDFKCYDFFSMQEVLAFELCTQKKCKKENSYGWDMCPLSGEGKCGAPWVKQIGLAHGIVNAGNKYEERMYVYPGFETGNDNRFSEKDWYDNYAEAVHAARSARFEFGQSGSTF